MCNVHEDEETQELLRRDATSAGRKCMKCEAKAVAIARTKDPFCRDCFHAYFTHRFRATFGKSRLVCAGEKALLAFSGGVSSRVMLALVEEGLSGQTYKKLRFVPSVIVIDEGAVLGQEWSERCQYQAEALSIAAQSGFPTYFTQLEQVFKSCEAYKLEDLLVDPPEEKTAASACELQDTASALLLPQREYVVSPADAIVATVEKTPNDIPEEMSEQLPVVGPVQGGNVLSSAASDIVDCEAAATPSDVVGLTPAIDLLPTASTTSTETETCHSNASPLTETPLHSKADPNLIAKRLTGFRRDLDSEVRLKGVFRATKSTTAKENLLLSLRHQLLVEIARKYGFVKVLVGDNATRLAVRLLGNIAQGRGGSLPLDTGFSDDRVKDVTFVRPMREFPGREIATYVSLDNLQTVTIPTLTTLAPEKASIEQLTETFITGLQADFPSTINTIFRTGDKLTVSDASQSEPCALCQAPRGHAADKSVYTHLILPEALSSDMSHPQDIWENLCYGCQLTVKEMNCSMASLPDFVLKKATTREQMKDEIQDFLLDDPN